MPTADPLTIGCLFSDRIEALLDGRVAIAGRTPAVTLMEAQALFRRTLREAAFDVAELSMASHIAAVGAGRRDYRALPMFPSRAFRHSNLYVRSDCVAGPGDLAGRRIGMIDWGQTAALWVRGILADDHGLDRTAVEWVAAGLHAPVADDRMAMTLPPGIRLSRSTSTLDTLLRDGDIDAVISPTAPRCFADGSAPVSRAFADPRAAERAWWQRTGLFPIMHVLVLRRSLAEADPTLPDAVTHAFVEAHRLATADLANRDYPKLALPWLAPMAADAWGALGGDPWTHGVAANHAVLDAMLRHAAADGLTPRRLTVAELFA